MIYVVGAICLAVGFIIGILLTIEINNDNDKKEIARLKKEVDKQFRHVGQLDDANIELNFKVQELQKKLGENERRSSDERLFVWRHNDYDRLMESHKNDLIDECLKTCEEIIASGTNIFHVKEILEDGSINIVKSTERKCSAEAVLRETDPTKRKLFIDVEKTPFKLRM